MTTATKEGNGKVDTIGNVSNDAEDMLTSEQPYTMRCKIEGASAMLFHRWSDDAVEAKAKAAKGSKAKKTDDVETYVWRDEDGNICLPGEYLRMACVMAAKFRQDPRSPRKSAMDLYKAGIVAATDMASLGKKEWDYLDRRRVVVQRNAITRLRPAFMQGWTATIDLLVTLPEYIAPSSLYDVLSLAGRTVGVGDFRPTFGRFMVVGFERWALA